MKNPIYCIVVILLFAFNASGIQSPDSLYNALHRNPNSDTIRFKILNEISQHYIYINIDSAKLYIDQMESLTDAINDPYYNAEVQRLKGDIEDRQGNFEASISYFEKALQLYEQLDKPFNQAVMHSEIGLSHRYLGNYIQSFDHYKAAEDILTKLNESKELSLLWLRYGINYHELANYNKASEYYFKALDITEKINNENVKGHCLNNLGMLFLHMNEYLRALDYFRQALALYGNQNHTQEYSATLGNIGLAYRNLEKYDSALFYHKKALAIQKRLKDKERQAVTYINLGYLYQEQQQYEKALSYYDQCLQLRKSAGQIRGQASVLSAMAETYLDMKQYDKSIKSAEGSFRISKSLNAWGLMVDATNVLAHAYASLNDHKNAYHFLQLNKQYNDSSITSEKTQQINNLRISYEADQKEQEIKLLNQDKALQEAEIQQQTLYRNITIGALLLLSILGFFIFRNYRLSQEKKRVQLSSALEQEKFEAERLQELDDAKSRFFANIAHEFRTPLTLINGPVQQIEEATKDERIKTNSSLIRRNADKLLSLINQLLDLSKLESGIIKLSPERREVMGFVKGCIHSFQSIAEQKDISLHISHDPDELEMDFDPEKMSIILNNLMSNALKFTQPFGAIKISVEQLSDEHQLIIKLADNGCGISKEKLSHIFDRFYQVDDSSVRKTQGTGIGLALTKELVELHNGKISVISQINEGTTFKIALPLHQDHTKIPENDIHPEPDKAIIDELTNDDINLPKTEAQEHHATDTVLVVEDNVEVRNFIVNAITPYYRIIEAEDGAKGIDTAIETIPDLIISDVMMPEKDGFQLCQKIKNDERTSHIPIVLLTAKAGIDSKLEGLGVGADDYLAKPFNTTELLTRIKNLIRVRQQLQQKYNANAEPVLPKKENAFIARVKEVIEENLTKEDMNMDELGRSMGMSRTQIFRKLKALTNLSTSQFIRNYRLEKALKLLQETDCNVAEAAYQVGFSTPAYFSTCFTEKYGYAPSEVNKSIS